MTESLFAIIFAIIDAVDRERVLENRYRQFEADAVGLPVGLGLGVVPFKLQLPDTTGSQ